MSFAASGVFRPTGSSVTPADAERVAGGVGIDLVAFGGGEVVGCLQQATTERNHLGVRAHRVFDVQIEVDLLRVSVRPVRRRVAGCELNADPPSHLRRR